MPTDGPKIFEDVRLATYELFKDVSTSAGAELITTQSIGGADAVTTKAESVKSLAASASASDTASGTQRSTSGTINTTSYTASPISATSTSSGSHSHGYDHWRLYGVIAAVGLYMHIV